MFKFISTFILVLAALFAGTVIFARVGLEPNSENDWVGRMIEKKLAAANAITRPKLVVIGGSGALFGIRAKELETELGVPAVNLATHFGLGPAYHLSVAKEVLKPGDTALLVFEYGSLEAQFDFSALLQRQVLFFDASYLLERPQATFNVLFGWKLYDGLTQEKVINAALYTVARINDHGDIDSSPNHADPDSIKRISESPDRWPIMPHPSNETVAALKRFVAFAITNNIRVLFSWPNIVRRDAYSTDKYKTAFNQLARFYKSFGISMVGRPEDAFFDLNEALDSPDHPSDETAKRRTCRLAHNLSGLVKHPTDSR